MATCFFLPRDRVLLTTGAVVLGAKIYFYETGTSTPKAVYSDAGGTTPITQPVEADAAGLLPDVFLDLSDGDYKAICNTSGGQNLWTIDPYSGDAGATDDDAGEAAAGAAYFNLLVNGGFVGKVRDVSGGTADDAYHFDCWYALTQTSTLTASQLTLPTGAARGLRYTQSHGSAQRIGLAQIVETVDTAASRGGYITAGGRVRCSVSQAIRYAILAWTGTSDAVTSDVVDDWTDASYTAGGFFIGTTTTVLGVGSVTPAVDTWTDLPPLTSSLLAQTVRNLVLVIWTEETLATGATLDFQRLRLVRGSTDPGWNPAPIADDIARCTRYIRKVSAEWTGPATSGVDYAVIQTLNPQMRDAPTCLTSAEIASPTDFPAHNTANVTAATTAQRVRIMRTANGTSTGSRWSGEYVLSAEL